jgi:hypothetical protein
LGVVGSEHVLLVVKEECGAHLHEEKFHSWESHRTKVFVRVSLKRRSQDMRNALAENVMVGLPTDVLMMGIDCDDEEEDRGWLDWMANVANVANEGQI